MPAKVPDMAEFVSLESLLFPAKLPGGGPVVGGRSVGAWESPGCSRAGVALRSRQRGRCPIGCGPIRWGGVCRVPGDCVTSVTGWGGDRVT